MDYTVVINGTRFASDDLFDFISPYFSRWVTVFEKLSSNLQPLSLERLHPCNHTSKLTVDGRNPAPVDK